MSEYSVKVERRDGVEIYVLESGDKRERAELAPSLGNNLFSFRAEEPLIEEIPFAQFVSKPTSYGIPILFPFPNRIRDGEFDFQGEHYEVDPPRHGFVRDKAWRVIDAGASDERGAWVRSQIAAVDYVGQILTQFPFEFSLEVEYRLKDGTLSMETVARNHDEADMPAGFGLHPYFRLPARGSVQVPASKRWQLEDSLPTGKLLDVEAAYDLRRARALDGLNLDDIYTAVTAEADGKARCYINDEEADSQTVVEFSPREFPHVVVYTPPAPRRAVCVEPNTCPTDAFNLQSKGIESDVIVLPPDGAATFHINIARRALPR